MKHEFFKNNTLTVLSALFSCALIFFAYASTRVDAAGDTTEVNITVNGCNNNYVCEAVIGEDSTTCPLDCGGTVTPTSTPSTGGNNGGSSGSKIKKPNQGQMSFDISIENIETFANSIKVTWSSSAPANGTIQWGTGSTYNLGLVQEVGYTYAHTFTLTGLSSDTNYSIEIRALGLDGTLVTRSISARTAASVAATQPVRNAEAHEIEGGVQLQWQNPDSAFDYIRIVRSESFFPADPYDGDVVYEGSARSFFDANVTEGTRYFYSIFVRGANGFSTGVLQNILLDAEQEFFGDVGMPVTIFGPIYDSTIVTSLHETDAAATVNMYQDGSEVTRLNNVFYAKNGKDVLITVDKSMLVPADSDVFVSYFPKNNTADSVDYALDYDAKEGKFLTTIRVENSVPSAPAIIYIRNNEKISGYLVYISTTIAEDDKVPKFWLAGWFRNDIFASLVLLSFVTIFLWLFLLFFFRRKSDNQKEN